MPYGAGNEVCIDFSKCVTEQDVWQVLRSKLCPGFDAFGCNCSALVDVLRGGFGVETPLELRIVFWAGRESNDGPGARAPLPPLDLRAPTRRT